MDSQPSAPQRGRISINLGITTTLSLLLLFTTLVLGFMIQLQLKSILHDELSRQLVTALRLAAGDIDGAALSGITQAEHEGQLAYRLIQNRLQKVQSAVPEIHFIYTMRRSAEGGAIFLVDADTDPETMSHVGDPYEDVTPSMEAALDSATPGSTFIESEPSQDDWGNWLSGYIVLDDGAGGNAGIIGIDIAASTIAENEFRVFLLTIGTSLATALLVLVLGIILSRRITKPLRTLSAEMQRITQLEVDGRTDIASVFKEIRLMSQAVDGMKTSLRAFKRYVPADLVADLILLHEEAVLGGERRNLTILFSDIENFTTWSEHQDPEQLIQVMAGYFGGMTRIIDARRGTVDKYIGDAIMAFWGAPAPLLDHPVQAARAALGCLGFQRIFNDELAARGIPAINTRFGINTGEVLVGNVGFEDRLNYTVMGDHVNLASRLENLNKLYATNIIISEHTLAQLGEGFVSRPLDRVVVKGKTESILIHELLFERADLGSELAGELLRLERLAESSAQAFHWYAQRDWERAAVAYGQILADHPKDGPAWLMYERCRKFAAQDPGHDWEGAIVLRDK